MTITRRRLLRGLSASLAVPWLESLPAADPPAAPAGPPRRFVCLYLANGVHSWDATQAGAGMTLSSALGPFAPLAGDLCILKGLQHTRMLKESRVKTHGSLGPTVLSGATANHSTTDIRVGTSMDQVLAARIGGATALPSLVLGVEPPTPGVDSGLSSVYLNHISWASPTRPVPREIHPALAFDALVDGGADRARAASILDLVRADAADLARDLAAADRRRVDEYLSAVRDVERRVQRAGAADAARPQPAGMQRPADGIPKDLREHMRLMLDLVVLALRMDRTRVITLMFNNERSTQDFSFLPGVPGDQYHPISHDGTGHAEITRFHSELVAGFLAQLKGIDEGGRSLLDSSLVLFLSAMRTGGSHSAVDLPVLLAGRGGGSLKPGRVLQYDERRGRLMCSLLLGIMDRMGVELPAFGDAERRLDGL